MNHRQRERLRRRYRPDRVRVPCIGEAPPASGRFFYRGDSGLYRAMHEAFQFADSSLAADAGCYLIDLCPEPVGHIGARSRRAARLASEASLSKTIARLRPSTIVTVVRSIEHIAIQAAARANWNGEVIHLSYPGPLDPPAARVRNSARTHPAKMRSNREEPHAYPSHLR